jgi:hypothetical protein
MLYMMEILHSESGGGTPIQSLVAGQERTQTKPFKAKRGAVRFGAEDLQPYAQSLHKTRL